MALAGSLVLLAIAGVLLWAGLEKLRTQEDFTATLSAIGAPGALRRVLSVGLPAAEIVTAVAIVVAPSATWPRIAVVSLALCFAGAGVLGLRAEEPITCSCFGNGTHRALGWFHIGLLPLWCLSVAAVVASSPSWALPEALRNLAGAALAIAVIRAVSLTRLRRVATADRLAFKPSTEPLPIFSRILEDVK